MKKSYLCLLFFCLFTPNSIQAVTPAPLPQQQWVPVQDLEGPPTAPLLLIEPLLDSQTVENLYVVDMNLKTNYYPPKPPSRYPDINIEGFYEGKISGRDYSPKLGEGLSTSDPLWQTIRNDSVYNKLPQDVLLGDPKLDIRYRFNIDGQLDENLSVHYDVEQEPDFPGKYDIEVEYKHNKFTFYHFDANFEQGDFINVKKALNGAMYESITPEWEARIATGRLRSTPQKFTSAGNNQKIMSIGRTNILYGSVKVWKNNRQLREGGDYSVNYFQGKLTFTSAPTTTDFIEVIYEFTNPIEDFIPVLNRKNFLGAQYKYRSKAIESYDKLSTQMTQTFIIPTDNSQISNVFYVDHTPIVLSSDVVNINGKVLRKNVDYFLKQHNGKLKIITHELKPEDKISISYEAHQTVQHEEDLIAENSPGWYQLQQQFLLDGTVKVSVDGRQVDEAIDYIIDYDKGRIRFNYSIFYPKIISVEYEALKTELKKQESMKNPLEVSVTYLNEYVKTEDQEIEQSISGENVSVVNNLITLNNNPISTLDSVEVSINEAILSAEKYTVDRYKGLITLLDTPATNDSIEVSYKYNKSFKTQQQFPYPELSSYTIRNFQEFNLDDIPVKFDGISEIRIQKSVEDGGLIKLSPNSDFTVDYGSDGESISLTFIKQGDNESKLTDDLLPDPGDQITLIYDFIPNESTGPGNIDQKMYGLTLGGNINDRWRLNTEVVAASNNISKPENSKSELLKGQGSTTAEYRLKHSNLVEDSEKITMAATGQTLTKGNQYIINYQNGIFKLINLSPSANEEIDVQYKYYDNAGQVELKDKNEITYATKVETTYDMDSVKVGGHFKTIDREYTALSPLRDSAGLTAFGGKLEWALSEQSDFNMDYERRAQFNGQKDNNEDAFTYNDRLNSQAKIKLFNTLDTTQSTSYTKTISDPLVTLGDKAGIHNKDSESFSYNVGVDFGSDNFKHHFSQGVGESNSDIIDQINPSQTKSQNFGYNATMSFEDLWLLGKTSVKPDYSTSLSRSKNITGANTDTPSESLSISHTENKGIKTTINPIKGLKGQMNIDQSKSTSRSHGTGDNSESISIAQNNYYRTDFTPYLWLNTYYQHSQNESKSPLLNTKSDRSTNTIYTISKLGVRGLLGTYFKVSPNSFLGKFIGGSYFTYNNNQNINMKNNDLSQTNSLTEGWSFNAFKPLKGLSLSKIAMSESSSRTLDLVQSTTASKNVNENNNQSREGNLSFTPSYPILKLFRYNLTLKEKTSNNTRNTQANTVTSNLTVDEDVDNTRNQSLSFTPGKLKVGIPGLALINLGSFSASAAESYLDRVDTSTSTKTPVDKNKEQEVSTTRDNQLKTTYTYNAGFAPFDLINFNGTYTDTDDKNVKHQSGLSYRLYDNFNVSTKYTFFRFLTLNGSYDNSQTKQFTSGSPEASLQALMDQRFKDPRDTSLFESGFEENNDTYRLGASIGLFKLLTISGGGSQSKRNSTNYVKDDKNTSTRFEQFSANAGTSISPIKGLNISYTYTVSHTYENDGDRNLGYTGDTSVRYKPLATKFVNVNVSYTRTDSWGSLFNELDKEQSVQGSGTTVETKIVESNHTVHNASVNVNVEYPLNHSPYLDKLVITGEGYVKRVEDRLDDQKESPNSYEVGGVVIKGTLFF